MSLSINNNVMAVNAARSLSKTYGKLSASVQRMSSGLRVNSAADDAAGLAIREIMRADISAAQQGMRNAADGISMIQTADGALSIIDEKLTRMKELAEQAATGTYTTVQRDIINSEYQAMAAEIDRIANSANFNGVKLLDGSVSNIHGGSCLKIHFGVSNSAAEDYYFVNIGDARATSSTGLKVGGDAKNDIWGQGAASSAPGGGSGCCTAGFSSLNDQAGFISGQSFAFGYNWDWQQDDDQELLSPRYLAGRYAVNSSDSLQDLINKVNQGSQSRVGIKIDGDALGRTIFGGSLTSLCIGDEAYVFASSNVLMTGAAGNQTFSTTTAKANAAYNAGIGYSNAGTATFVFNETDYLARQGLNNLGKATGQVPGNKRNGLELSDDSEDYIKNVVAPQFQDEIDAFAAASWQANRVEIGGISHSRATIVNNAWNNIQSQIPANAFNSSGEIVSGLSFTVSTGIYGNFSNVNNPRGVFSNDPVLINELGLTELTLKFTTNTTGLGPLPTTLTLETGTGQHLGSLSTADPLTQPIKQADFQAACLSGLRQAFSSTSQMIELTNKGAYLGTPTVETGHIQVEVVSSVHPLTLQNKEATLMRRDANGNFGAEGLAETINLNGNSKFWAMMDQDDPDMLYIFAREGGDNNSMLACEAGAMEPHSQSALECFSFFNVESGIWNEFGTNFTLGGGDWASLKPLQTRAYNGTEVWNLTLNGRDVGPERDLWIAGHGDIITPGLDQGIITGMDRDSFQEIQNADNAPWAGAEIRTQSSAQEALDILTEAIIKKDKIRADLGAMQNRLENTMTNLEIQTENLQAAESRISDADIAKEMTEFTKSNVLAQAAVSMLAQANSMSQLALSLLG